MRLRAFPVFEALGAALGYLVPGLASLGMGCGHAGVSTEASPSNAPTRNVPVAAETRGKAPAPRALPEWFPCADHELSRCEAGCADNHVEDCVTLGSIHLAGTLVPLDQARAISLFQSACSTGSARGCIRLGDLYRAGVLSGEAEETNLYRRACDAGANLGCLHTGRAYLTGRGVGVDAVFAFTLFARGCERGNAPSCFELGRLRDVGEGTPRDRAKAFELFSKACKLGHDEACLYAGRTEEVLPPRE